MDNYIIKQILFAWFCYDNQRHLQELQTSQFLILGCFFDILCDFYKLHISTRRYVRHFDLFVVKLWGRL